MKTAEEILKSKLNNTQWNYLDHVLHSGEVYKQILVGMEEYAEQFKISSNPLLSADADIIPFGMWLTGHDKETIEQMYRDWNWAFADNSRIDVG